MFIFFVHQKNLSKILKYGLAGLAGGAAAAAAGGKVGLATMGPMAKHFGGVAAAQGAALQGAAIGLPIGIALAMLAVYLYRRYKDPCRKKCLNLSGLAKEKCQRQCEYDAATKMISTLKAELSKCGRTPKPDKCKKKLSSMINKWQERQQKAKIKLSKTVG